MHDKVSSDVPNENGIVLPQRTELLEKLVQRVENRFWMIVDNGKQLEIMGDTIIVVIPVSTMNVITSKISKLADGQGLIHFQTNDGTNVNRVAISYNSYERAEKALESLTDFLRNKNEYILEEVHDRHKIKGAANDANKNKALKEKIDNALDNPNNFSNEPSAVYSNYDATSKVKQPSEIKWDDIKNEGDYWGEQFQEEKPSFFRKIFNLFKK